jgi:replication factor C subunit 1
VKSFILAAVVYADADQYREKMQVPANVVDQLIQGSQSDIRQVLNMLSTWKLSSRKMDFDEGKAL